MVRRDLVERLWASDAASALTNEAARRIDELEGALKNLVAANEAVQLVLCDGPEVPGFDPKELPRAQYAVVEAEREAKYVLREG